MNQTLSSGDSGKVSTRTMGFEHTLAPSRRYVLSQKRPSIPDLWFYRCNNCDRITRVEKLRVEAYGITDLIGRWGKPGQMSLGRPKPFHMDMLLCEACKPKFRLWLNGKQKLDKLQRGRGDRFLHPLLQNRTWHALNRKRLDTAESGEAYDAEIRA